MVWITFLGINIYVSFTTNAFIVKVNEFLYYEQFIQQLRNTDSHLFNLYHRAVNNGKGTASKMNHMATKLRQQQQKQQRYKTSWETQRRKRVLMKHSDIKPIYKFFGHTTCIGHCNIQFMQYLKLGFFFFLSKTMPWKCECMRWRLTCLIAM